MNTPGDWRKSSHSGPGDGDACVEISDCGTHIFLRDSKDPTAGILTFPTGTFTTFVEDLKAQLRHS